MTDVYECFRIAYNAKIISNELNTKPTKIQKYLTEEDFFEDWVKYMTSPTLKERLLKSLIRRPT